MRFLFVKNSLSWPRSSGHDVHSYYLMKELIDAGHDVSLATVVPLDPAAKQGLKLVGEYSLSRRFDEEPPLYKLNRLQEKFRNYWGVDTDQIYAVQLAEAESNADVVVVVGLEVLPYLAGVANSVKVWYAADEWFWHHVSLVEAFNRSTWNHLWSAVLKGAYERSFGSLIDQAWVVSKRDQLAMKIVAGLKSVPVLPNGVDTEYYRCSDQPKLEKSCVFWGRLDFEPNIQALEWFCKQVWPSIVAEESKAVFQIYGFNPGPEIISLAKGAGISLSSDLPDIRDGISRHQIVVLPFVSGGGIKNKLLEAASMSMPIICTPRTTNGLRCNDSSCFLFATTKEEWKAQILTLWGDSLQRRDRGTALRNWVTQNHSWKSTAQEAISAVKPFIRGRTTQD